MSDSAPSTVPAATANAPLGRRTRIVDVAREAGVSAQTVSNVLNGRPGFSDATRARVLAAVEDTGYVPDQAGRHLRTGQSRRIAFSMTEENLDARNPFALTFLQAVMTTAADLDRRVLVFTHASGSVEAFRADAVGRETDGFILANSAPGDYRVEILEELGIPYALMGRTLPTQSQEWIDIDNAAAIRRAVDHAVARGFRELAYADYGGEAHWSLERLRGVREGLAAHGLTLSDERIIRGPIDRIQKRLTRMLEKDAVLDGVLTASDSIGIMAVNVAHAAGRDVGTDFAVTGFDGGVLASTVIPNLTTVRIPVAEIARRLMVGLTELIDTGKRWPAGEIVDTELVIGGSA